MATRLPAPASPLRHWSAWLPVAISVFFIALALRHVAIVYFAYTWLPKSPRLALSGQSLGRVF